MVDTDKFLAEVRQEIARLRRIESAILESSVGKSSGPEKKSNRMSEAGRTVISLAAKLRHAGRSGDKARIKALTQQLKTAKKAAEATKR